MATQLQNLVARRDAVAAEIAAISSSRAGGLPNATGPGANVDHTGYKKSLYDELERLNDLINAAEGPFAVEMFEQ